MSNVRSALYPDDATIARVLAVLTQEPPNPPAPRRQRTGRPPRQDIDSPYTGYVRDRSPVRDGRRRRPVSRQLLFDDQDIEIMNDENALIINNPSPDSEAYVVLNDFFDQVEKVLEEKKEEKEEQRLQDIQNKNVNVKLMGRTPRVVRSQDMDDWIEAKRIEDEEKYLARLREDKPVVYQPMPLGPLIVPPRHEYYVYVDEEFRDKYDDVYRGRDAPQLTEQQRAMLARPVSDMSSPTPSSDSPTPVFNRNRTQTDWTNFSPPPVTPLQRRNPPSLQTGGISQSSCSKEWKDSNSKWLTNMYMHAAVKSVSDVVTQ